MEYKKPQAFLVDMDGTMIDTEKFWIQSEKDVAQKYGKVMPEDLSLELVGTAVSYSGQLIVETLNIDVDHRIFTQEIIDNVVKYMSEDEI